MSPVKRTVKNKNILVTGGAGFIGSHLVDYLSQCGVNKLVIVDNLFCGKVENLIPLESRNISFYEKDAQDFDFLKKTILEHKIDYVFNLATKALNYSFENPRDAFSVNTNIASNLLELQRAGTFSSLCHYSSSEVYGTAIYEPMDEKHPFHPTTTYAAGKAATDLLIESYVSMFKLDVVTIRPFNNFGPRQNYEGPLTGVIPRIVSQIIHGKAPTLQGDGKQQRDFVFARDTVRISVDLFEKSNSGEAFNICAEKGIEIRGLIQAIQKIMGSTEPWVYQPERNSDVRTHNGSMKKARALCQIPLSGFDSALTETIEWYKKRLSNS